MEVGRERRKERRRYCDVSICREIHSFHSRLYITQVYVVTKDDNKHKAMIAALAAINEDAENAAILGELKVCWVYSLLFPCLS